MGKNITLRFEASSKEELTKDRENIIWTKDTVGLNEDLGYNPNSYYHTDEDLYPSEILVFVEDKCVAEFELADGPADSRGCLSWHYQASNSQNDEAGSYGYVCSVDINIDDLTEQFTVSIHSVKGFSLYGRKSGRYSMGIEIIV